MKSERLGKTCEIETPLTIFDGDRVRDRVLQVRDRILATEDTVCLERARLVTAAFRRYADDPPPLKRAKTLAYVLDHMTLDLESNPFFAGNASTGPRAWMLVPEYGFREPAQIVHENPQLRGILEPRTPGDPIPEDLRDFWEHRSFGGSAGIGHLAVNLERVVQEGVASMIEEAESRLEHGPQEHRIYRRAMVIALQALIDWAERYAGAAERAAESANDPLIRAAHLRVAEACRRVPARPARTLFEGLQAIVLVHLALHIEGHGLSVSIGLPDRALSPFVDSDPEGCTNSMTNMVAAFLLKIHANSIFGRGSKTQAITVGGMDYKGVDQCNALTRAFLDACDLVRVGDPHLFLRWHRAIDGGIKERAIEMLASSASMPLLIHDVPTAQGFVDAGVAEEDAWDYCVIGCNELGIPGRSAESATATSGLIQYLELLNQVLLEHPSPDEIETVDEFLRLLQARMADHASKTRESGQKHRRRVAREMPTPLTSALMDGCIRRGLDFMVGMDCHLPSHYERGLTNAVNALAAIQTVVFEERAASMAELVEAMRRNFEGAEDLRLRLRGAPKWGNDIPRVDRFAERLLAMRRRVLDNVDNEMGSAPHMVCHVVRSLHYFDGWRISASPDGRFAGTPVADSVGAESGTASRGPTGVLNSVLRLDPARNYRGGTNLNLTLPAAQWRRPEMQSALLSLVETFFAGGGQELQVAVLDPDTLRDAQVHPERYADLLVRVAGFNARFVELAPVEQEEMTRRAEAVQ
ncbi:MAG: pyruvate formate lyase family protein [Anaerolineae bacterium]